MPSPFPGMDPFLEHPAIFPDLHDAMVGYIRESLQARLPEPYYAAVASRTWVELDARFVVPDALPEPDVFIVRRNEEGPAREITAGLAAVPAVRSQPIIVHVPRDERRHTYVEVCTPERAGRVVTVIEILSRSNKSPGDLAHGLYEQSQRETLYSSTHLVEIDLLRTGQHATAVPERRLAEAVGAVDYHVCLHRFNRLEDFYVYPIRLEERLPETVVPLLPGDPDIPLDLQAVFERCYEAGAYQRRVRYRDLTAIVPPLSPERMEWVSRLL